MHEHMDDIPTTMLETFISKTVKVTTIFALHAILFTRFGFNHKAFSLITIIFLHPFFQFMTLILCCMSANSNSTVWSFL